MLASGTGAGSSTADPPPPPLVVWVGAAMEAAAARTAAALLARADGLDAMLCIRAAGLCWWLDAVTTCC